jgi:CRP-like cAMP-binding protein
MQELIEYFERYTPISLEAKTELAGTVKIIKTCKGQILLHQGNVCRNLYIIKNGFLRGYYFQDGKEFTSWFAFENDVAASMYSFVTQKPGYESIEALEDSTLYSIEYNQLQYFYKKYMEINLIGRLFTEKYYISLEERKNSLQFQSAKDRYEGLLEKQPRLLQRASLGMIASYLGISQETLSRIRNKI